MRDTFERQLDISDPQRPEVWSRLRDVNLIASCSSAVGDVREVTPDEEWSVTLVRAVGRFKLTAPLSVSIRDEIVGQRIDVLMRGSDRKMGARLDVEASLVVEEGDGGTLLFLRGEYEVTGRIATLGSSIVRRHADEMIDEFTANFQTAVREGLGIS